jgi:hypothetical protein
MIAAEAVRVSLARRPVMIDGIDDALVKPKLSLQAFSSAEPLQHKLHLSTNEGEEPNGMYLQWGND